MSKVPASTVGFCINDSNADAIADNLVHQLQRATAELESQVNRLYRGRHSYDLTDSAQADVDKAVERLAYMAKTLREIRKEQSKVVYLQAAE